MYRITEDYWISNPFYPFEDPDFSVRTPRGYGRKMAFLAIPSPGENFILIKTKLFGLYLFVCMGTDNYALEPIFTK